jgi:cysteine desulfurase
VTYIYLDNNATTPCDPAAMEAMLPFFGSRYANPASPHGMGKDSFAAIERARESTSEFLRCSTSELHFTSGATESNNIVLAGFAPSNGRRRIVASAIEHKSVQLPLRHRRDSGMAVEEMAVDGNGVVDLCSAESLIHEDTALVSLQAANNETGVLQPVGEVASIAHSRGALFHCDASQWIGKLPIPDWFDQCDYLSVSAHKFYGPKGVGALVVRNGTPRKHIWPLYFGGGQEYGLRPGTLNVPGIVGLSVACELAAERVATDVALIAQLRNSFEALLQRSVPSSRINGAGVARIPGSSSITIPDVPASMLIANLPSVCIAEGSACTSGATEPSHVLVAMGLSRDDADCSIRVSFGRQNTMTEAEAATDMIALAAKRLLGPPIGVQSFCGTSSKGGKT